jgi:hypothetical protein
MKPLDELTIDAKAILGLQLPTDPRWVNLAEKSMEEILTDHAYCEQKVAFLLYNDTMKKKDWLSGSLLLLPRNGDILD